MRTLAKHFCGLLAASARVLASGAPRAAARRTFTVQGPSDSSEAGAASLPGAILQARPHVANADSCDLVRVPTEVRAVSSDGFGGMFGGMQAPRARVSGVDPESRGAAENVRPPEPLA